MKRYMFIVLGLNLTLVLVCGFADTALMALLLGYSHCSEDNEEILKTFFEMNYDTPWDNQKILEDSEERRIISRMNIGIGSKNSVIRDSLRFIR